MDRLKKDEIAISFEDQQEMQDFLTEMVKRDKWIPFVMDLAKFTVSDEGNLVLQYHDDDQNVKEVPFSVLAMFTANQRLGISCPAVNKIVESAKFNDYALMANLGLSTKKKKEESLMLIRGERVCAMHTAKYKVLEQSKAFKIVSSYIEQTFNDARFISGIFTHDLTHATWSLGGEDSALLKTYSDAWRKAGLDDERHEATSPVVEFATCDTGLHTVALYPKITIDKHIYHVGEPIKIKHYGENTTEDIEKSMSLVFSALEDASNTFAQMISLDINYPVETFVAAVKAVGLDKIVPKILRGILDIEIAAAAYGATSTAFMVYDAINDVTRVPEYETLVDSTKIRINESLNRLLKIDWKAIDKPGRREI